jgi:hypothetical protein
MNVADKTECLSVFSESCEGRYEPGYRQLEAEGLLTLSEDGIATCRQHLNTVACEQQVRELAGPCQSMWQGQQSVDGDCSYDVEALVCESGTECVLELTLCGTCTAVADLGAPCGDGVGCGTDAHCVEGFCVARVNIGEICTVDDRCVISANCIAGTCVGPTHVDVGDECDQQNRCPYMTACVNGTCVATQRIGAECSGDGDCATGYCNDGTCAGLLTAGLACDRGEQCTSSRCENGTCAALPGPCF